MKKWQWRQKFEADLEEIINKNSKENKSDTPDFILAQYLKRCLCAFDSAVNQREIWYGRKKK